MHETGQSMVGLQPTLDHVSVTMSSGVGELLPLLKPSLVANVDQSALLDTLVELGEFNQAEPPSPLHIHFPPARFEGDTGGTARKVIDDHGKFVARRVEVPLFKIIRTTVGPDRRIKAGPNVDDDCLYEYDGDKCNEILLHELKHAVDYLDPAIRRRQRRYIGVEHRRIKRQYGMLMAITAWEAGIAEAAVSNTEIKVGAAALAAYALRTLIKARRTDLETKLYYDWDGYRNSPLERNAYRVSDTARQQGKLPSIFTLSEITDWHS